MRADTGRPAARPSRRQLLKGAAGLGLAVAGGSVLAGCASQAAPFFSPWTGSQLETTTIRLVQAPTVCQAPEYVVQDLRQAEGFTDVQYIQKDGTKGIEA